ncbi:MAG TPA: hypothetical protein VFA46_23680 [Actinomycetes bacterium]|nr:hypothetical protein [Actinomycetes bacterium]
MAHAEHAEHEEFPGVRQACGEAQLEAMAATHPHPEVDSTAANLLTGPFAAMADRVHGERNGY